MSTNDLLKWAHDETKMADALEDSMATFGAMIGLDVAESITRHRTRSRWLDEQVARRLDEKEEKERGNG
jgi:hypothetical protein